MIKGTMGWAIGLLYSWLILACAPAGVQSNRSSLQQESESLRLSPEDEARLIMEEAGLTPEGDPVLYAELVRELRQPQTCSNGSSSGSPGSASGLGGASGPGGGLFLGGGGSGSGSEAGGVNSGATPGVVGKLNLEVTISNRDSARLVDRIFDDIIAGLEGLFASSSHTGWGILEAMDFRDRAKDWIEENVEGIALARLGEFLRERDLKFVASRPSEEDIGVLAAKIREWFTENSEFDGFDVSAQFSMDIKKQILGSGLERVRQAILAMNFGGGRNWWRIKDSIWNRARPQLVCEINQALVQAEKTAEGAIKQAVRDVLRRLEAQQMIRRESYTVALDSSQSLSRLYAKIGLGSLGYEIWLDIVREKGLIGTLFSTMNGDPSNP